MKNLADSHWVIAQQNEPAIKLTYQWLKCPKNDHRTLGEFLHGRVPQQEQWLYAAHQKDFVEKRGMVYLRTTPSRSQEQVLAFVVPTHKRRAAIDGCHRFAGHQGRDRMVSLIKERFWWPGMIQDAMSSVRNCARCVQFEAWVQKPNLHPIICTELMDLVHIDYIKMEVTVGVKQKPVVKDVLVVEDHFTRYIQAYMTKNHTARTTARVLYNEYFSVFGFPRRLMSDQAPEFSGRVIAAMCDLLGVSKVRTSPYHPQSNGVVERAHQTLRCMIGKMDPEKRSKWPSHLGSVIIAYNATRSLVTGFLPYFLMFGRRPHLPIDLLFPTAMRQETSRTVDEYVLSLYERLKEALPVARDSTKLEAQRQKRHYDRRAGAVELQPGDKVLIKLDAFRGQHRKLKNRWSGELHTVVNRVADGVPTYVVTGDKTGKRQVLHRARLLLWQAEFDGDPLRVNCILIDSSLPGTDLKTQPWRGGRTNAVPRSLVYGLNMTLLQSQQESSNPRAGYLARGALTGTPRNGTGYRIPEVGKRIRRVGGMCPDRGDDPVR